MEATQAELPGLATAAGETAVDGLRKNLSAIAEAQAYQDLSGQVIRRVIQLVKGVENALADLLDLAGLDVAGAQPEPHIAGGPALVGLDNHGSTQAQADDLLADLGL